MAGKKLLQQVREKIRAKHYSMRTEKAYVAWITRFIKFNNLRHPARMAAAEVQAYLNYLATHEHVASSTQNSPSEIT